MQDRTHEYQIQRYLSRLYLEQVVAGVYASVSEMLGEALLRTAFFDDENGGDHEPWDIN
jgi:hypothetical protein